MTGASRLLTASISAARNPTHDEVEQVAEQLWQDAFAGSSGTSWQDLDRQSSMHERVERLALAAFGFSYWPERIVI